MHPSVCKHILPSLPFKPNPLIIHLGNYNSAEGKIDCMEIESLFNIYLDHKILNQIEYLL